MATVELRFSALPEHVRTARLVAAAVARRAGVDESVLDEVRLAVGEACSRAVGLHRRHSLDEPVRVKLIEQEKRFQIEVGDGVGGKHAADDGHAADGAAVDDAAEAAMGLAVISGLVDDLDIGSDDDGGLIRMSWPLAVHPVLP
ncbi:ATP-binding protein [Streptacidiphilus sp. PB12-B1b]|uniref:ATP-binding protein n=1 Tax=Streptacidiphilus sp. PB12-B1b TaxID=2705012 RepID=UPI0015F97548|nr:ATP-binding protein [Streptacidiphilus sp. PB12-B1b]QMU74682.1 ATP-binding protein [Streptacidiphilus sp. PB12-B1b]